jgi:hypothetical protein
MRKFIERLGLVSFLLGMMSIDSANFLYPVALAIIGYILMKKSGLASEDFNKYREK